MKASTYATFMKVFAVILAAIIASAIVVELPLYVPVLAIIFALLIAAIMRRQVKEVMADERNQRIQERATSLAYRLYTILGAAASMVLLVLRSNLPEWAFIAGQTLAYSICALMLIHLAFTSYFEKKL